MKIVRVIFRNRPFPFCLSHYFIFSSTFLPPDTDTTPFFTSDEYFRTFRKFDDTDRHSRFFMKVGIRWDVATNTQPSCLVLYLFSLSSYQWRNVFSLASLFHRFLFFPSKTLQALITFISRNGPLAPRLYNSRAKWEKILHL